MAFDPVLAEPKRLPRTALEGKKKGGKFGKIKERAIRYNAHCDNPLYHVNFDARLAELRSLRRRIDRYLKGQWKVGGQALRQHGDEKKKWLDEELRPAVDDAITETIEGATESESGGGLGLGAEVSSPKPLGRFGKLKERAASALARFDPQVAKATGGRGREELVLGAASDVYFSESEEESEEEAAAEAKEEGLQGEEEEEEEEAEEEEAEEGGLQEGAEFLDPAAKKEMRNFFSLENQLDIVWPIEQMRLNNRAARGDLASGNKAEARKKQKHQIALAKTGAKMAVGEALELIGPFAGLIAKAPLAAKAMRDTQKQRMKLKGAKAGARTAGNVTLVGAIARALQLKKEHQVKKGLSPVPGVAAAQKAYGLWRSSKTEEEERERENLAKIFLEEARAGDEIAQAVVYTLVKGERYYIAAMDAESTGYKLVADKLKT